MSAFVKVNQIAQTVESLSADPGEEFPFLHTITVVDRVVSVDKAELVQNNIKTETVTLNLDSEWEGLSTVINIGNERPVSVIWSGEPVVIPAELMTTVGSLDVSVVGYGDDGGIRAVTKQAKSVFDVVASGFVEGDEAVPDPTTILGQLIQAADNANQAADRFNQASDDIEGIGPAIEKVQASETNAAASAKAAKTSETNAATSATAAQNAVDGFGLEVGTTTTGDPGTDAIVNIVKQGTKYVADFTIPRGADGQGGSGGLSTISHDTTLTGDGTSGSPLGLAARTFLTPTDITDLNTAMETGVYEMTTAPSNSPAGNIRGFLIVGKIFSTINFIVQLAVLSYTNGKQEPSVWTRNGVGGGSISWNPWHRVDVTDYVTTATYQALEARVQALEAKLANQ